MKNLPWTKKYEPKKLTEVVGQNSGISQLKHFITSYSPGKSILIYGSTGVGKTCAVYAAANELGYEILEVNASDSRNKQEIEKIIGASSTQMSLFKRGKIILIDETDGISGHHDRGCVPAIAAAVNKSSWPVVLIANNPWIDKLKAIRKNSVLVEFQPLSSSEVTFLLKRICEKENILYDESLLRSIAHRCGGDARAAINDLQSAALNKKILNLDVLGNRETEESIFNALRLIFKSSSATDVLGAFDNVEADWRECIMWVDENIPLEYPPEFLKEAYNWLSRADVFNGRISRQQYWRFLVYIYSLITAGIATSKKSKKPGFTEYRRSTRILKLWQAKMRYAKKESIISKLAPYNHVSKNVARRDLFPFFHTLIKSNSSNNNFSRIAADLRLDDGETSWLLDH